MFLRTSSFSTLHIRISGIAHGLEEIILEDTVRLPLCLILEEFRDEREKLETYWTDQESFDRWIEKELAYYADAKLQDREVEVLSDLERIQRRNELDRQMLEKMKKAAEENGDQE